MKTKIKDAFWAAHAWITGNTTTFILWCLVVFAVVCGVIAFASSGDKFSFPRQADVVLPLGHVLILTPGQSATLLRDVDVEASVPAQGEPLFKGIVRLRAGTVVIAPIVEEIPAKE